MAVCPTCQGTFQGASFCPRDGSRLDLELAADQLLGGRYRLIRRVGEGAMGVVFEAEHVAIRRRVAVKVLQRRLAENAEAVERMRREAQAMSGLGHPNIVDCTDFGRSDDGQFYLVMEWLDGETLDDRMAREPVDLALALEIAAQACSGLAEAHAQGVIHRDLKPANLFLSRDRKGKLLVKLLDFGIAKLAADQSQLTSTGVLIGTPNYMAPEQALGEAVDPRADLYAVGIILYEMLTGMVPFQADTPLAVLHQHTARMPAAPSTAAPDRRIPEDVDTITMTCLAKDPSDRYPTAAALGAAIEAARAGIATDIPVAPPPRPPTAPTGARTPEPTVEGLDEELAAIRGRGRRHLVVAGGIVAVLGAGVLAMVLSQRDRDGRGSSVRTDAAAVDVRTPVEPPADGALATDGRAEPLVDARTEGPVDAREAIDAQVETPRVVVRVVERAFTVDGALMPAPVTAGQQTTLELVVSNLNASNAALLRDGQVRVRVVIQHFAAHDVVGNSTISLGADGLARLTFVPRLGKHHVVVEPIAGARSLGKARFDLHAAAR